MKLRLARWVRKADRAVSRDSKHLMVDDQAKAHAFYTEKLVVR